MLQAGQCHGTNVGEMGALCRGNGNVTGGVPFVASVLGRNTHALTGEGCDASEDGTGRGTPIVAETLRVGGREQGAGSSHDNTPWVMAFQDRTRGTEVEHGDGTLAGSLRAGDGGSSRSRKLIDGRGIPRRLTPRECERLQGLPDDWTAWGVDEDGERVDMADTPRYRMLGNAVSVPVAAWIGKRIADVQAEMKKEQAA